MKRILQQKWRYFADNATMHGVHRASAPDRHVLRRVTWAVLLLSSLVFVFGNTSQLVNKLVHPRLSTKIEVSSELPQKFPSITICNMNQIKRSYAEKNLKARLFVEQFYPYGRDFIYDSPEQADEAHSTINLNNISIKTLLIDAAHSLHETITWAWFYEDDTYYTGQNMSDIFYPVLTSYGRCYSLNKSWEVSRPGLSSGVQLIINVLPEEYFASLSDTMSEGALITIHKGHVTPDLLEESFVVGTGVEARAGIMVKNYHHHPSNGCRADVRPSGLLNAPTYSRSMCMLQCQQQHVNKRCNCTSFYSPGDERICRWQKEINCAKRISTVVDCSANCSDACWESGYFVHVSYSGFPSNSVLNAVWSNSSNRNETAHMISVFIYFETLRSQITSEFQTFNLGDFGSSLGGILGLFLGSSILTIVEWVELFGDMLIACLTYCSGGRKRQRVDGTAVSGKVPERGSDTA